MTTYIVSYDLKAPDKDYDEIIDYLKSQPGWWHHLGSTWVIVTDLTANGLRDGILKRVDADDKVLVVQSASVGAWAGFPSKGSDWLKKNL